MRKVNLIQQRNEIECDVSSASDKSGSQFQTSPALSSKMFGIMEPVSKNQLKKASCRRVFAKLTELTNNYPELLFAESPLAVLRNGARSCSVDYG
jgi:hypothetical protein